MLLPDKKLILGFKQKSISPNSPHQALFPHVGSFPWQNSSFSAPVCSHTVPRSEPASSERVFPERAQEVTDSSEVGCPMDQDGHA